VSAPGLQANQCTIPAVTARRAATSAVALASAAGTVRVRTQIIHSGVARPTARIGRVRRQIGGSARIIFVGVRHLASHHRSAV